MISKQSTEAITNKKYVDLLKSAKELFWKHGFKRVSIEEICKNAEVSKVTFYRFFPNKLEIAKAVFDQVVEEGIDRFKNIMHDETLSASEKMKRIVQMKVENTNNISHEFLKDFYGENESGLASYIQAKGKSAWDEIILDFKDAQQKGWIRKDLNIEFYLNVTQRLSSLVTDQQLAQFFNTPQELVLELTNLLAYGISPRDKESNE